MIVEQIKAELLQTCKTIVDNRFIKVKQTISDIEESMLGEDKSSAGDKHETGRAMLQIDRENAGKQLSEIEKLKQLYKLIDIKATSDYARLGSLINTNHAYFFISLSVGAVMVNKTNYLCVALNSPIGVQLSGKRKGDSFVFNEKEYLVTSVK